MFYRALLAAIAAVAIATPVFADDTMSSSDSSSTSMQSEQMQEKVNINTATAKDLMKVKGINASKARAIVSYRKKNGDFKTVDDLANVKGFKKLDTSKFQQITSQLTTE